MSMKNLEEKEKECWGKFDTKHLFCVLTTRRTKTKIFEFYGFNK